jgi:glycosidase
LWGILFAKLGVFFCNFVRFYFTTNTVGENIIKMVNSGFDIDMGENMGFALGMEKTYQMFRDVEPDFIDAPFLSLHDQERSINRMEKDISKAKLAANIYLTLPGNPFMYYGEEIGMQGTKPDEKLREPFLWSNDENQQQTFWLPIQHNKNSIPVDEQQKDSSSMFRHYNKIIRLRQSSKALMLGDFFALETNTKNVISYGRSYINENEKESVIIVHNLSEEEQIVSLDKDCMVNSKILFESTNEGKNMLDGYEFTIAPQTTIINRK